MDLTKGLAIQERRVFSQLGDFANQKNSPILLFSSSPLLKEKRVFSSAVLGNSHSRSAFTRPTPLNSIFKRQKEVCSIPLGSSDSHTIYRISAPSFLSSVKVGNNPREIQGSAESLDGKLPSKSQCISATVYIQEICHLDLDTSQTLWRTFIERDRSHQTVPGYTYNFLRKEAPPSANNPLTQKLNIM